MGPSEATADGPDVGTHGLTKAVPLGPWQPGHGGHALPLWFL